MSLELAITENTAALRELIARLTATAQTSIQTAVEVAVVKAEDLPVTKKPADPAPVAESKTEAVTYDQVKSKVVALSKEKGREPTVALLQRHGVAKAPDLKPEQYSDVVRDIDAIFAGTYNPVAAETV